MKKLIVLVILSGLAGPLGEASEPKPEGPAIEVKPFKEIEKKVELGLLVKEAKKLDKDLAALAVELVEKAFRVNLSKEKVLYALSDCFIKTPKEFEGKDEYPFPTIGSAGCVVRLYLEEKGVWKKLFEDNLIDFLGVLPTKEKDSLQVLVSLHGGQFDRAGNKYGYGLLVYKKGKLSISKGKGSSALEAFKPSQTFHFQEAK